MKRQTILIIGASGLVGSGFVSEVIKNKFIDELITPSHKEMDITDLLSLKKNIDMYRPDVIVNFAAHRNANTAEEQRGNKTASAWMVNVEGVKNLVKLCKFKKIRLIQISTDYVFGGRKDKKGPYSEEELPEKNKKRLSWYGWTKRLAEKVVLEGGINNCVVRIGNVVKPVYDPKLDYVGKVLWLYDQNKLYPIFDNQFLTLSYVPEISKALMNLLNSKKIGGVFHVASCDSTTPFDMAEYLLLKSRSKKGIIKRSDIDKFSRNNPNRYPKYGGLKTKNTQSKLKIEFSSWKKIVDEFIKHADILNNKKNK